MTLDIGHPTFLTLTQDVTDPILNPFTITYTDSQTVDSDVGIVYTVSYTVVLKEYLGLVPEFKSSFSFKVLCPLTVISSSVTVPVQASTLYDVANPNGITVPIM